MAELEEDVVALMCKRVYDLSGVLGKSVKVPLPGVPAHMRACGVCAAGLDKNGQCYP